MEAGGIYILTTPGSKGGEEFRITHAYGVRGITGKDSDGHGDAAISKPMVKKLFGHCKVFVDKSEADCHADNMFYRYELSDPFLVADGINRICLHRKFEYYGGKSDEKKGKDAGKKDGKKDDKKDSKKDGKKVGKICNKKH